MSRSFILLRRVLCGVSCTVVLAGGALHASAAYADPIPPPEYCIVGEGHERCNEFCLPYGQWGYCNPATGRCDCGDT